MKKIPATARTAQLILGLLFAVSFFLVSGCETETATEPPAKENRPKISSFGSEAAEGEGPSRTMSGDGE